MSFHRNGSNPTREIEEIQDKLDAVRQLIRAGIEVNRNRKRETYLEMRLHELQNQIRQQQG